jgi:hypothetical protein
VPPHTLAALPTCWLTGLIPAFTPQTGDRVTLKNHLPALIAPLVLALGAPSLMSDPFLWRFVCNATWNAVHLPVVGPVLAVGPFPALAALVYRLARDARGSKPSPGRPSAIAYRAAILGLLAVALSAFPLVVSYVAFEKRDADPTPAPTPAPREIYTRMRSTKTTPPLNPPDLALSTPPPIQEATAGRSKTRPLSVTTSDEGCDQ